MMSAKSVNWYIKLFLGIACIAIIGFYTYIQSDDFARGPILTIDTPTNGSYFEDSRIDVEGVALNISDIQLNGAPIFIDEEGHFSEELLLVSGQNSITVTARDRFGREAERVLQLVYRQ